AEFSEPFATLEGARLEDARLDALEQRIDADLALRRHAELVGELESLIAEQPYRERSRAQLMLALYRAGRHAEALGAYRAARAAFAELGSERSERLRELERAILSQHASLAPAQRKSNLPVAQTRLVGRAREIGEVVALLRHDDVSLVTLTGAGGSGK